MRLRTLARFSLLSGSLAFPIVFTAWAQTPSSDYAKEAFVVEKMATDVTFAKDGTSRREQTFVIRVQSEAAVRELGVLVSPYNAESERLEFVYVRVRKADGSVVSTPDSMVQDVPSAVTRTAPTYSDLREKQVPVRALGAGDVLEYQVRVVQTKPDIPNQFWYTHDFFKAGIALEESLRIVVPGDQYVKIKSPNTIPLLAEENGQKSYLWKTSNLKAPTPEEAAKNAAQAGEQEHSVQLTTFQSWEEVGRWYRELAASQERVTPAVQAKALELTKDISTQDEKERVLYEFVSSKFRYISLSFGVGRYQPHTADEVLANQYGDCKDKHTLLSALLKAVGVEASPALIGAGLKFDSEVPSPAQFNHVITVIAGGAKNRIWLDATAEVAPFGMLMGAIRDKQALVIPANAAPSLVNTPAEPPFPSYELVESKSDLSTEGTLKGHFEFTLRGDAEVLIRSAFHGVPPTQWQEIAQQVSYALGFNGKVSNVEIENLDNTSKPFHYSYDYIRENYSDWADRRITPPMPPFGLPGTEDDKPPVEPIVLSDTGDITYRATIHLPPGYSVEIPSGSKAQTDFSSYSSSYSVADSVLAAERHMVLKTSKVQVGMWPEYQSFRKIVAEDGNHFVVLSAANATSSVTITENNAEAEELIQNAVAAMQRRDINAARDALAQAERLNPKQLNLWTAYGFLYLGTNEKQKGIDSLEKEISLHPGNTPAYRMLVAARIANNENDEAAGALQKLLKVVPSDADATLQLSRLLIEGKRYAEAVETVRVALALTPDDAGMQQQWAEVLLRNGQKEEGVAAARKVADSSKDDTVLNSVAYVLADTNTELPLAKVYAEKAVAQAESDAKGITLAGLTNDDLGRMTRLNMYWDTLGWAYFRAGDLGKAEKYLYAAWQLGQTGEVADHLAQVYEKQGKRDEAIDTLRLALASNSGLTDASQRLKDMGAPENAPATKVSPAEQLGKMRTTGMPALATQEGSAEFFLVFSRDKVEETSFISGAPSLKDAGSVLSKARFDAAFPDDGPERIVRRGILSCSKYTTPSCQITMLLPSTARK